MPRSRLFLEWLVVLAGALAISWWALAYKTTSRIDMALLDRVTTWGASPPSPDLILVTIDERSLRDEGQWPWDRRKVALLTDRIAAASPRLIELDVLFPEASDAEADAALAASIAASGKVVLPFGFAPAEGRIDGLDPVMPLPELALAAAGLGHVALEPDSDGSIRRVALKIEENGKSYPQLQVAALDALRAAPAHTATEASVVLLRPAGSFRAVSASAVLRGEVPTAFLRDKIVLVGATAEGLGDIHPVPYPVGGLMPGVELQANLLQGLLEGSLVNTAPLPAGLAFCWLPVVLLFAGFWRLRPAACLVLAAGLVIALPLASGLIAHALRIWIAPGPALLAIVVAYPLWGWRRLAALSDYLLAKSNRLVEAEKALPTQVGGFDVLAQEVGKLDYLVDEVSARRDFLRRVLETTPDAICVFDASGRLQMLNGHAAEVFAKAAPGQNFDAMMADAGAVPAEGVDELVLPDGRHFAISRSSEALPQAWDAIAIVTLADVTAQRRSERERREMLEFLSHDMRAPQVAILNLVSQEDEAPERLQRIRAHARRTMELADNFVQLARLSEVPLACEDVDAGALLAEAADRAWPLASTRGVTIATALPYEPLFVMGDGQVLSRVFDNLVGNAIKYGRDRGKIGLSIERQGDDTVIVVSDDGPGLPQSRKDDPFRRFGQREKDTGGTGLGLSFVAEAIARHGGTITVDSAPGAGTCFRISLAALPDLPEA